MRRNNGKNLTGSFPSDMSLVRAFECLLENANDAFYVLDRRGRVVAANRTVEALIGIKRRNLLGKTLKEIVSASKLPKSIKGLVKTVKKKPIRLELEFKTATGKTIDVESTSIPCLSHGRFVGILGIIREITERKKMEKALRESEERSRFIVENSPSGLGIIDDHFRIIYVNNEVCRILGRSRDEIVGKDYRKFLDNESKALVQESYLRRQRGERAPSWHECKVVRKDGERRSIETTSTIMRDSNGKMQSIAQIVDVTERKKLEERLSALNYYGGELNRAQSIQQIYRLTLDAIEETLGFETAAFMMVEKGCLQVGDQRGYGEPKLRMPLNGKGITVKAANTRRPVIVPDVAKDKDYVRGAPGVQSEIAVPVENEDRVMGVLDVESKELGAFDEKDAVLLEVLASHAATAIGNLEKRAEIEKRHSQLALLMNSSAEMIHTTHLSQRLQKIAEAIRQLGWQRVVIRAVKDQGMELTNPEDMVTAGLTDEEREFLWTNRMPGQVWRERFGPEFERFRVGEFYHLPWSDPWVRKKFAQGTVSSRLSPEQMVDWDPQDLLYAPLRLADGSIVGILSIDDPVDGKRPTKESLTPLELFIHQAAVAIENAQLIQQLNTARNQIREYADQLELKVKQRTQELVEAQSKLIKTERLATIGEVAAMVGHDLRNPLTGITGATYYLKMKLTSRMNSKAKEMLELIDKDIDYANKIINDLLDYSKEIFLEARETTVKSIIEEALSLVNVPKNINVLDLTEDTLRIQVDVEKMKRVFVNIIKNAIDAMPQGGKLTIESKEKGGNLEIAFSDTGIGMPKDVLEKLWTALFTTKAKGMGFGLPICKRIVEAHGGSISVESTVGKGTTFTVTIPIKPKIEEGGEKVWVNVPESLLSTMTKA